MSISSAPSFNVSTFSNGGANYTTTNKVIGTRAFACLKYINSIESRLKLTSPVSVHTHVLTFTNRDFSVRCVRPDSAGNTSSGSLEGEKGNFDDESRVVEIGSGDRQIDDFGGGGDNGGGGSFGGGDGGQGDSEDEREFGPILKFEDVMKEVEARGGELPPDMMEAAKRNGIRKLFLLRYLDLQESVWPLGFLIKYCSMLRNRMLADPSFLFKVGTEKCLNAVSTMVCTDPSLFGWPMMMYGSLQSPGGSILWNGINTGAKIQSAESDWWFEDISYFSVGLFERLIKTMEARGIRSEYLAGAVMYYARKYLPGLGRWQSRPSSKARTVASFSLIPAAVDQRDLLENIEKLLPKKKGKSFCRFLLGLLRVASILGVKQTCLDSLERRIGMQLELASLDGLLIPSFSNSDTLYDTDCVERIIHHFMSSESGLTLFSPPSFEPLRKVARLIDNYLAEVASDVNLKPGEIRSLAEVLPDSSRTLHDGLYRALDIYFRAHPWLSDREKEVLCNIIDYGKLSIDACAHASQNKRLPLRVVLQVLFFEQLHLRAALAGCLNVLEAESAPTGQGVAPTEIAGNVTATGETGQRIVQRDGWVTIVRENQVLKVDMERMRSRVGELEDEVSKIKREMKKVKKSRSSLSSPCIVAGKFGCKPLSKSSDSQTDVVGSTGPTPRPSFEQPHSSRHSRHRKSLSLFRDLTHGS